MSWGTLLFLDRTGARSKARKSSKVPVMVEREKVAVIASPVSDMTVGTGLKYEEGKYSGLIDLVLSRSVSACPNSPS